MGKISSLVLLVNALSKGEKRYFKLYSSLQNGNKDYLLLFNAIEKGMETKELKKYFLHKKPGASYDVAANYLFKRILESMLHVRTEKNLAAKLMTGLLKANLLVEKGLYEDGFKQLHAIQLRAEKAEMHIVQLWASSLELDYISSLNFHTISEEDLIHKQMKIQRLLNYSKHIYQHTSLYQLLHHRLLYKGAVRTQQQKEELNDLVVTEINLVSKPFAAGFDSQKTHLLFQAYYFITISDYKSALSAFYELNRLFEENFELWAETPLDYLLTVEGILDSLHSIRRYEEMRFFLDKLMNLQALDGYYEITVHRIRYTYTVLLLLDKGDFRQAELVKEQYQESLFKQIALLDLSRQAEIYLYTALIYFGKGDMKKAHFYLNGVLFENKLFYSLPVYRSFRLIHLLVHYEFGNHDYIKHEIRSFKRSWGVNNKAYLVEKMVFGFLRLQPLPSSAKARQQLWEKIKREFERIKADKYEIQMLKTFNFSTWIESKLMKKPFEALLRAHHKESTMEVLTA